MPTGDHTIVFHRNQAESEVSAVDFAALLKKLKEGHGLTWAQMADRTGRAPGTLKSYAFGKRTWVSQKVADDILQRLAGVALPPTPRQQAVYTQLRRKDQSEQRSETLSSRKLGDRKAQVEQLRSKLSALPLSEG